MNSSSVMTVDESKFKAVQFALEQLKEQMLALQAREKSRILLTGTELDEAESSGDVAWMLSATIFVLMMTTPGITLYYAGMVRLQNVLSTAMQGYSIACVVTFLWLSFGYSLSFSPSQSSGGTRIFGSTERLWLAGITEGTHQSAPTIPETAFCAFQLAFAIITPSLICGAFADRMKFSAVIISLGLWHLLVYCPIAHSNWHPEGFLNKAGVLDFAGGNVVHISAGVAAMVSAVIVGKRTGFGTGSFHPHNMLISLTGDVTPLQTCFNSLLSLCYYIVTIIITFIDITII